jgi:ANTAR domain
LNSLTARVDSDPVTVAVARIVENRAVIEQAKGVLMAVYDIDADDAFDLLKLRSQETNTKLRVVAERLMTEFRLSQWAQKGLPRFNVRTKCSFKPTSVVNDA